ncbi:hypothetical protein CEY12_11380 [Chryseobacterium sp. T16E-39]|uniref:anthrone oxygenase family protein n=1 Tax=Chryseobacterium sp. T16E-39 TaxID=2015076 RepID=UPI000B5B377C|nr:DUF1772 domain-containing protein [Chryseobacterium sp. T16E-39]ASK30678.1 hypothetical protein CEY12_11380 [Chryseobacterium sp. T16E-39]
MRPLILFVYIIIGSGILFVNIYNSLIDAPNWGRNIPDSLETARNYFQQKTPGDFFKIVGMSYHLIGLVTIILLWNSYPQVKGYMIPAFVLFILADVLTVVYFFPRNSILFEQKPIDIKAAVQAWKEWSRMNWIRSLLLLTGIVLSCIALHRTYR